VEKTHSLLKRQLKRHLGGLGSLPGEWQALLEAVNTAYLEYDEDRRMLERSLELSSQELLQRNSEVRAVFQAFPDLFFRLDAQGTILDYKAGRTADLYLPPEKLIGKRIQDIPLKDVGKKFHQSIQQLKKTKSFVSMEYSLKIEKQEQFYEARLLPLLENQIIVIVRNITERKKAEEALRESEERLKLVVEGAELGTWDQNMITGEVVRNRRWAEMLGYTLEEIEAHANAWKALIHPDDLPGVERITQDHRAGRTPFLRCEHRMRTKSGEWRWILNCGKIIERDLKGRPIRAVGTHTDITDHKRTEEALRQSEKKYRTLIESAHESIGLADSEENLILANQAFADTLGYKKEELLGLNISRLCDEDQFAVFRKETEKRKRGQYSRYEAKLYTKSGEPKDFNMSAAPLFDENESFIGTLSFLVDITESKRAKKALQESEKKYSTIVEKGNDGIIIIQDGLIKFANSTIAAMTGLNPEEVMEKPFIHHVSPAYREMVMDIYKKRVIGKESPNKYEIEISAKDGKQIPVEVSASLIEYEGKPADMAIIRDVTERKQAEKMLRESEIRYRTVFESNPMGIGMASQEGEILACNDAMKRITGYSDVELRQINLKDTYQNSEDRFKLLQLLQEKGFIRNFEVVLKRKNGSLFNASLTITPMTLGGKNILLTITEDVTERKQAEEELQRTHFAIDSALEGMAWINKNFNYIYVNEGMCRMLGYTREEFLSLKPSDLDLSFPQVPTAELWVEMREVKSLVREGSFRRKDGTTFPAEIIINHVIFKNEEYIFNIMRDITERKQAEEKLQESEERYRDLFENASDMIQSVDGQGKFVYVNKKWKEVLGYSDEEINQLKFTDVLRIDQIPHCVELFKKIMAGETAEDVEVIFVTKTGREIFASGFVSPRRKDGKFIASRAIFRNVTERKQAEQLLRTSEAQLSIAMRIAKLGYWEYDVVKDLFTFNDHFYSIFRTTVEEVGGYTMSSARYAQLFVHPDDAHLVAIEVKKSIEATDPNFVSQLEHRIIYADGEVGYISVRIYLVKDDQGRTIKTFGANQDITERKRAEEELNRLSNAVSMSRDSIVVSDLEGKIVEVNQAAMNMYGTDEKNDLVGRNYLELIVPEDRQKMLVSTQEALRNGYVESREYQIITKPGNIVPIELSATVLKDQNGKPSGFVSIIRDITEHRKAEEALRKSEHRYRSYIELTDQLAWITNANGEAMEDIPDWRKYTGQSFEEIKGQGWSKALHPDDVEPSLQAWMEAVKTKSAFETEYRIRRYDGVYRNFLARGIPEFNQEGIIQEWVGTCIDVTELKKTEENLRKSMEEAKESNRLKSEFLANMSHEIRTPMNAIIGMTGITLDTKLTDEQREYLRIVKESSYSLLGLLDDILDLSKIEAGRVELENINFDLRSVVDSVIDTLNTRAAAKGLELACFIDSAVHPFLRGDPARLRQILLNLGGNAIKFTEKGEVAIQVELQAETEKYTTLLFSVTDTGIGVPKDKTAEIFKSFTQADGSTTRKYGGTGLGLSISKRLVELMQGEIAVESQIGKGSRFWFKIKLEKQQGIQEIHPHFTYSPRGCRILVVDDNQTNRTILIKILESFHYVPAAVESGKKAIPILKQSLEQNKPFDLVLLDMQMPEMDGEETLRLIQNDPRIKEIPVVILTSIGQRGDTNRLEALGAAGYLLKPVKQSQLYDTIITILSKKKKYQAEPWVTPKIDSPTISEPIHKGVRLLVAEDNPMNQKLAVTLLERAGFSVEAVENGKLAVEAIEQTDYDLVLMDVQMPEMDGFEATRAIRRMQGEKRHTPIIAMTAHVMKGDQERCLAEGMDDYVSKPIEPQAMFKVIGKWIGTSVTEETTPAVEEVRERQPDPGIPVDKENVLRRLDGDMDMFKELMTEFLSYVPEHVGNLEKAVGKADVKWVIREAHTIKGAAGNLGANNLAEFALRLEQLGRTGNLDRGENLIADLKNELKRVDEYARQSLGIESTEKLDVKP
jgi:PAS domain S-box-containing protein